MLATDGPAVLKLMVPCCLAATAVALVATTRYRIADGVLTVTRMFKRRRIPLARITAVRCLRAGPFFAVDDFALGTAVVEVEVSGWTTLVSPRREREFLAALGFPNDTRGRTQRRSVSMS